MFYIESDLGDWSEAATMREAQLAGECLLGDNPRARESDIYLSESDPYPVGTVAYAAIGTGYVMRSSGRTSMARIYEVNHDREVRA